MNLRVIISYFYICSLVIAQTEPTNNYVLCFSDNSFHDVEMTDARAIVNVLGKKLITEYDKTAGGGSVVFNLETELQKHIDDGADMFILLSTEYLEVQNNKSLIPRYSIIVDGGIGFKYNLLINKSSGIQSFSDLRNKSISVLGNNFESPSFYWLSSITKKNANVFPQDYFDKIVLKPKAKSIILSVFFNQIDACLTSSNSLEIVSELNPQIAENLIIIEESPSLLTGLICFNESIIGTQKEKVLIKALESLHNNYYGKQLLDLYSIEQLIPFDEKHLINVINLMKGLKVK